MKMRSLLFAVIPLLLTACGPSLASQVDMSIAMQPSEIVVSRQNHLQQKANITWEIQNHSSETLKQSEYEFSLGYGRVGETTTELMTKIEHDISTEKPETGVYEHTFGAREGMDGKYELRFSFSEKNPDHSYTLIKEVKIPFTQKWNK